MPSTNLAGLYSEGLEGGSVGVRVLGTNNDLYRDGNRTRKDEHRETGWVDQPYVRFTQLRTRESSRTLSLKRGRSFARG